jgi:hypothetical protein
MFRKNNWVKVSNYNSSDIDPSDNLSDFGLVHIYKIKDIDATSVEIDVFNMVLNSNLQYGVVDIRNKRVCFERYVNL